MAIKVNGTTITKLLVGSTDIKQVRVRKNESSEWVIVFQATSGASWDEYEFALDQLREAFDAIGANYDSTLPDYKNAYVNLVNLFSYGCVPICRQPYFILSHERANISNLIDGNGALRFWTSLDEANVMSAVAGEPHTIYMLKPVLFSELGKVLYLKNIINCRAMDPLTANLKKFLYMPLIRYDDNSKTLKPSEIVSKISYSDDCTTVTIKIKDNFKYKNGNSIIAADYANFLNTHYSTQVSEHYSILNSRYLVPGGDYLESVIAEDSNTLVFQFNSSKGLRNKQLLYSLLVNVIPIPSAGNSMMSTDGGGGYVAMYYASGPYYLKSITDTSITLSANTNYPFGNSDFVSVYTSGLGNIIFNVECESYDDLFTQMDNDVYGVCIISDDTRPFDVSHSTSSYYCSQSMSQRVWFLGNFSMSTTSFANKDFQVVARTIDRESITTNGPTFEAIDNITGETATYHIFEAEQDLENKKYIFLPSNHYLLSATDSVPYATRDFTRVTEGLSDTTVENVGIATYESEIWKYVGGIIKNSVGRDTNTNTLITDNMTPYDIINTDMGSAFDGKWVTIPYHYDSKYMAYDPDFFIDDKWKVFPLQATNF